MVIIGGGGGGSSSGDHWLERQTSARTCPMDLLRLSVSLCGVGSFGLW